jgi:serine/threonine protein kinase
MAPLDETATTIVRESTTNPDATIVVSDSSQQRTAIDVTQPMLHDSTQRTVISDASEKLAAAEPTPKAIVISDDDPLAPGAMLGDYRIERKVAEGGWGTVFSAVHPLIGKRVAVKVLKKSLCERPDAVKRFMDEARTVNHIGHPNIVDVFTFGETHTGRSYFMMEWLKGQPLSTRIRRGEIPFDEICAIVKPVARALEAAHAKGIVHRDVKPENVFLVYTPGEPLRVKLLDFGIAKLVHHIGMGKTSTGEIIGTPPYMAPEQARGKSVDFKADIYSLGAMLFELLTGRTPFVADNAADEIAALLTKPAPKVSSLAPSTPRELDELVGAMLAKDPDRRPSLRDVCSVLDHLLDQLLERAQRPRARSMAESVGSASSSIFDWARERKRLVLAVGAAITIGVVAAVVVTRMGDNRDKGTLSLTVHGATSYEVVVDDRHVPVDNGKLELPPGFHRIEIRAPGMKPDSFGVNTTAGSVMKQTVTLTPAPR